MVRRLVAHSYQAFTIHSIINAMSLLILESLTESRAASVTDEKKQGMVEKILIFRQLPTHITLHIAYIVHYWYQVLSK